MVSLAPCRRATVGTQRGVRPTASVETLQVRAVSRIVGVEAVGDQIVDLIDAGRRVRVGGVAIGNRIVGVDDAAGVVVRTAGVVGALMEAKAVGLEAGEWSLRTLRDFARITPES